MDILDLVVKDQEFVDRTVFSTFANFTFKNITITNCEFNNIFTDCQFINCKFIDCKMCSDFTLCIFDACTFENVEWDAWIEETKVFSKFAKVQIINCKLLKCNFKMIEFELVNVVNCKINKCNFIYSLGEIESHGNSFRNCTGQLVVTVKKKLQFKGKV